MVAVYPLDRDAAAAEQRDLLLRVRGHRDGNGNAVELQVAQLLLLGADDRDRRRRFEIRAADARAGDDDRRLGEIVEGLTHDRGRRRWRDRGDFVRPALRPAME